jgi:hypothetical protein
MSPTPTELAFLTLLWKKSPRTAREMQLLIFTLCSGMIVCFSVLGVKCNLQMGEWPRYWLIVY